MDSRYRDSLFTFSRTCISMLAVLVLAGCQMQQMDHGEEIGVTFTDANFDQEVLQSEMPVLVDFSATWCGPCQMMKPIVESLHENFEGRAKVGVLDVDNSPEMASKYSITALPMMLVFKDGQEVERLEGTRPYAKLSEILEKHIDQPTSASL